MECYSKVYVAVFWPVVERWRAWQARRLELARAAARAYAGGGGR